MSFIHMCIHCYKFERRLCWLLSSLLQQYKDIGISVNIASLKDAVTDPMIEDVVGFFEKEGLNISRISFERDIFAKRGLTRNVQIKKSKSDWLFFADADNVYHPKFFGNLERYLNTQYDGTTKCITSVKKYHTETEDTNYVVNSLNYPCLIKDVYNRANNIPVYSKKNKNVAAGCMQVVRRDVMNRITGGIYIRPRSCRDWHLFKDGQRARSDMQFRRAMGGTKRITLPTQIHLNHYRDKQSEIVHLEEQR